MLKDVRMSIALLLLSHAIPQMAAAQATPGPLAHTYSIVARDPSTGDMGVAVQSHAISVGAMQTGWGEAGVGVIATQSFVDPTYGSKGLELMRGGVSAGDALTRLTSADPAKEGRQVAILDAQGRVAVHTGAGAIASAGHSSGNQYSVQANLMANPKVWSAMATAYETAKGDLAERLLAALDAAQATGGDIRGKMSATLLVVRAKSSGRPWFGADRLFDVRVDVHPEPLVELRRLVRVQRAANHTTRGGELMSEKKIEQAKAEYREALRLAPEITELAFWYGATLLEVREEAEAMLVLRDVLKKDPVWFEVLKRVIAAGLLPDDPALLKRVEALLGKR